MLFRSELKKKLANLSKDSDSSSSEEEESEEEESEEEESETEAKKKERRIVHHPRRITTAKFTFSPPPKSGPGSNKKVVQIEAPTEIDKEKKEKTKKRVIKHHRAASNSANNDPKQLTLDAFKISVGQKENSTEKTASPVKTRKISFLFEDEERPKTIEIDSEAKENLKKRKFEEILDKKRTSLENTEKKEDKEEKEEKGLEEDSGHGSSQENEAKKRRIE